MIAAKLEKPEKKLNTLKKATPKTSSAKKTAVKK
jgi:hypothetical protein